MVENGWKWDDWQLELINHKGHVSARCGRQTGKSTGVSKRRPDQMLRYVGSVSLVIDPAERQSSGLFDKTLGWLELKNREVLAAALAFRVDSNVGSKANLSRRRPSLTRIRGFEQPGPALPETGRRGERCQ